MDFGKRCSPCPSQASLFLTLQQVVSPELFLPARWTEGSQSQQDGPAWSPEGGKATEGKLMQIRGRVHS